VGSIFSNTTLATSTPATSRSSTPAPIQHKDTGKRRQPPPPPPSSRQNLIILDDSTDSEEIEMEPESQSQAGRVTHIRGFEVHTQDTEGDDEFDWE
jgi:hypothetical protein